VRTSIGRWGGWHLRAHRSPWNTRLRLHSAMQRSVELPAATRRDLGAVAAVCWNCDSDLGPVRAPSVARDLRN
jgi:hypothetical protein